MGRKRSKPFGSEINQSVEDVQPNRGRARVSLSVRASVKAATSKNRLPENMKRRGGRRRRRMHKKLEERNAQQTPRRNTEILFGPPTSFATADECFSRNP